MKNITQDQLIRHIMDNFDFRKVNKVMKALNWQWREQGVPTVAMLKESALRLLTEASYKTEDFTIATGGFEVNWYVENRYLRLQFQLAEWDSVPEDIDESDIDDFEFDVDMGKVQ